MAQFDGAIGAVKADQPQQVTFMVHKAATIVDGTWERSPSPSLPRPR